MITGKATRLFLPDARQVSEIERLTEFKEIFSPMLPADSASTIRNDGRTNAMPTAVPPRIPERT